MYTWKILKTCILIPAEFVSTITTKKVAPTSTNMPRRFRLDLLARFCHNKMGRLIRAMPMIGKLEKAKKEVTIETRANQSAPRERESAMKEQSSNTVEIVQTLPVWTMTRGKNVVKVRISRAKRPDSSFISFLQNLSVITSKTMNATRLSKRTGKYASQVWVLSIWISPRIEKLVKGKIKISIGNINK